MNCPIYVTTWRVLASAAFPRERYHHHVSLDFEECVAFACEVLAFRRHMDVTIVEVLP